VMAIPKRKSSRRCWKRRRCIFADEAKFKNQEYD
jgi:hypothetical protein